MRCAAADTLCRVLGLRHALPACPHRVDGFVIVHSHPFSGAANGSAPLNHTPQQFQLIAHLSLLVMVAAVALSFAARLLGVRYVFRMMRPVGCLRLAIRTCSLRAPPVC